MSQENDTKRIPLFDKRRVYNQCTRKKGFTTTKEANKAIRSALYHDHVKLSYYQCQVCGKFHLTSKYVKSKF